MEVNPRTRLIDRCSEICGGQNKLAKRLGVGSGRISSLRTGDQAMPPAVLAQLADIAELSGEEARTLLAQIEVEQQKDPRKAEVMRKAFFGCWVLGVALSATPGSAISSAHPGAAVVYGLYIVRTWKRMRRQAAHGLSAVKVRPFLLNERHHVA